MLIRFNVLLAVLKALLIGKKKKKKTCSEYKSHLPTRANLSYISL